MASNPKAPEPKEIRDAFSEYENEWREIREEGAVDLKYVSGDPWTKEDRAAREEAGRPCISLDELNQYLNQYNNSLRQNKRAIQIIPKGSGANDEDASKRENIIRGIENESNAQEAYITMAENAASRSEGYLLLRTEYPDDYKEGDEPSTQLFDQKIVIKRVANSGTILLNPGFQKANASDVEDGFVFKRIRRSEFARKYQNAEKQSFDATDMREAKDWIGDKDLQIAEYWKTFRTPKKLLALDTPTGLITMWEEKFKKMNGEMKGVEVFDERMVDIKQVVEYPTNGLEVLDEIPWAGSRIPIISCFGKELWVDEGSGAKRRLLSMIRLARDAQMLFAYMCTQEAEEAAKAPKSIYIGAKGSFESARQVWEMLNKQPFSFVEYDVISDGSPTPLGPPQMIQFSPNFQAYEIAKDSLRRSIQAAIGGIPLTTAAQTDKEKSGVTIERIETQTSIGTFHFQDNFDMALENVGWQVNELITPILDTQRELPIGKPDGTYSTLHTIGNTSHPLDDTGAYQVQGIPANEQTGEPEEHLHTGKGTFGVTISTGPSYQSQREQASEFVDHLIANWQQLGIPAPLAQKILALGIKLKDIGPIGDAIQELLSPPDNMEGFPPEAQSAITQLQGQLQQLQQENAALHQDRAARVLEQSTKLQIEDKKIAAKGQADAAQHVSDVNLAQLSNDVKVLIAEIQTKAQAESERVQMYKEFWIENHKAAHDVGMQAADQEHQQGMADQAAQNASAQAVQSASLQAQQPENQPQGQGQ